MVSKDEALKMAIEALMAGSKIADTFLPSDDRTIQISKAINACKEALEVVDRPEQPAQEPVAWIAEDLMSTTVSKNLAQRWVKNGGKAIPLYTHPHQWQGLTDDEIARLSDEAFGTKLADVLGESDDLDFNFARAIEQALKEKNNGL